MSAEKETFLEIPKEKLTPEALDGLVEEFILREGTDYGHEEVTLAEKKERIMNQLQAGYLKIVFSSETQDCTFIKSNQ